MKSRPGSALRLLGWLALSLGLFLPAVGHEGMTRAQRRQFAVHYTAAWCSQQPEKVAAFFEPQGSLRINDAPPAVERAAITESVRGFMTAFPDLKVSMDRLLVSAAGIEYHWKLTGTNSGPGGGGRQVHIKGFEVWRFGAENLIAESQGHFDSAAYQRQLAAP